MVVAFPNFVIFNNSFIHSSHNLLGRTSKQAKVPGIPQLHHQTCFFFVFWLLLFLLGRHHPSIHPAHPRLRFLHPRLQITLILLQPLLLLLRLRTFAKRLPETPLERLAVQLSLLGRDKVLARIPEFDLLPFEARLMHPDVVGVARIGMGAAFAAEDGEHVEAVLERRCGWVDEAAVVVACGQDASGFDDAADGL